MKSHLKRITILLVVITVNFTSPVLFYSANSFYENNSSVNSKNNLMNTIKLVNENERVSLFPEEVTNRYQSQNAGIPKVLITLNSSLGTEINYCSIIVFKLSWTIIPVINTAVTLLYQNLSYYISNTNYKYIIMNDPNNLNSFNVKFTLLIYDSNNNRFTKSLSILFNPNYCGNNTFPLLNAKTNEIVYKGNTIPELPLIISSGIIIGIGTIVWIYYHEHKKRGE